MDTFKAFRKEPSCLEVSTVMLLLGVSWMGIFKRQQKKKMKQKHHLEKLKMIIMTILLMMMIILIRNQMMSAKVAAQAIMEVSLVETFSNNKLKGTKRVSMEEGNITVVSCMVSWRTIKK